MAKVGDGMYLCIDMQSFFASVECSLRGLNPKEVALAVVDDRRGDGALVMAASPKLKEYGVKSRCRLYEIDKNISFIKARPRMKYYIYYAKRIHQIFLKYVSKDDCLLYSIDESFLKIDDYLAYYGGSGKALALKIMSSIEEELGIYATCGAGDNMYLSKVALDILAKKNQGYFYLTKELFCKMLWDHKPITDFWGIAFGISRHLASLGIYTMRDIANANSELLKKEFGVIGEEMQAHAYGLEDVSLKDVKEYKPVNKSLSRGQILFRDYTKEEAFIPLMEMVFILSLDMCNKNIDAKGMSFFVGYSKDIGQIVSKSISFDYRLRDYKKIIEILREFYDKLVFEGPIRNVGISFFNIRRIENRQLSLFYIEEERHVELCKTIARIQGLYGKNAVLPGVALYKESTLIYRNKCIGGHNGE